MWDVIDQWYKCVLGLGAPFLMVVVSFSPHFRNYLSCINLHLPLVSGTKNDVNK